MRFPSILRNALLCGGISTAFLCTGIQPAYVCTASSESRSLQFYETWKEQYLRQDSYITNEVQYYVWYSDAQYTGGTESIPVTVSEAHGYGMLITASMAGTDPDAKSIFDGLYRFYVAHPSSIGTHLMSWQQSDNGTALIDGADDGSMTDGSCDSAADGDLDIAYALLLADTLWGSDGDIDYQEAALLLLQDILQYEVHPKYNTICLGDWTSECEETDPYRTAVRCSDFTLSYFPIFAEATGNPQWMKVYYSTYAVMEALLQDSDTGLLPDFAIRNSDGSYVPAEADFLEGESDGIYSYNSCRTPWRISTDALVTGNPKAYQFAKTISRFFAQKTNWNPELVQAGYTLDGTETETYQELCFLAPLLTAASCSGDSQWHMAIREAVEAYESAGYFGDTLRLLCLLTDDGLWKAPMQAANGDINLDGTVTIADAVQLQKWLISGEPPTSWKNDDLVPDEMLTGLDLCKLKRMLVTSKNPYTNERKHAIIET